MLSSPHLQTDLPIVRSSSIAVAVPLTSLEGVSAREGGQRSRRLRDG
jgi:hypothetical protein